MGMLQKLAGMLGVRDDQVGDALSDEQRCKKQLTRRGLLAAGATIVGGALLPTKAYSFGTPYGCAFLGVDYGTLEWTVLAQYAKYDAILTFRIDGRMRGSVSELRADASGELVERAISRANIYLPEGRIEEIVEE